ncbi:MAG: Tat pathway signal protein [Pseudanabaenaceae cyanobacterium]|jgi:hypothetical protein
MGISRRQFLHSAMKGGTALVAATSTGIFFPKPAEAFILGMVLRSLAARAVFSTIRLHSAGQNVSILGGLSEEEKLQIQLADQEYVERAFTRDRTELARVPESVYRGYERMDNWGPNVGFAFTQRVDSYTSAAKVSGPTMAALYKAVERMGQSGISSDIIADSMLPLRSQVDDRSDWMDYSSSSNYRTALGEVTSTYELVQPGRGGYGNVELIVDAGGQPQRRFSVQVRF